MSLLMLILLGFGCYLAIHGLVSLRIIYNWILHQVLLNTAKKYECQIQYLYADPNKKADNVYFHAVKYKCLDKHGKTFTAYTVNKKARTLFPEYESGIITYYKHNDTVFITDFVPNDPIALNMFDEKPIDGNYIGAAFLTIGTPIATIMLAILIFLFASIFMKQ